MINKKIIELVGELKFVSKKMHMRCSFSDARPVEEAIELLKELDERRSQTCQNCRCYDQGFCNNPMGLFKARADDHCSRYASKPHHERIDPNENDHRTW